MRILFYSYAYPNPLQPGLGTFNRTMVKSLARCHEVSVISPVSFIDVWKSRLRGKRLNDPAFQAVAGVPASYVPFYYPPRVMRSSFDRFQDWTAGRTLAQRLATDRPDVVLSYWTHPDGAVAVRAAHRAGIPAAVFVGGSDVLILGRKGSRRQAIVKVLHEADAVLTVSEHLKATMEADGIAAGKIHVVRRGVDRSVFSPGDQKDARRQLATRGPGINPSDSRPWVVSVGRLVEVKDFPNLISAIDRLKQQGLAVRCDILGDGPLRRTLQGMIDASGLSDQVTLHGAQSQEQLAQWYRAADLLCLSSRSEGVPNVLLEGMACGVRIVATEVGGIPEIIDRSCDQLVAAHNPAALADGLKNALNAQIDGEQTRRSVLPPSLEESANQLGRILQSCVRSHSGGPGESFEETCVTETQVSTRSLIASGTEVCP